MAIANPEQIVIPAGTTASKTVTIATNGAKSLVAVLNITAQTGTVTVTFSGNTASGLQWTLLQSAALGAVAQTVFRISPDLTNSANLVAKDIVPETVQVAAVVAGGTATYGLDVSLGS